MLKSKEGFEAFISQHGLLCPICCGEMQVIRNRTTLLCRACRDRGIVICTYSAETMNEVLADLMWPAADTDRDWRDVVVGQEKVAPIRQ